MLIKLLLQIIIIIILQYFQAVTLGKQRANKAQLMLFNASGFASIVLTTKKINGEFMPVGNEQLATIIHMENGYTAIIVDKDGYTKAQSKILEKKIAINIFNKLLKNGAAKYDGEYVNIWTNKYPTFLSKN